MFRILVATGLSLFLSSGAMACAVSDFSIKGSHWHRASGHNAEAIGELVNDCTDPAMAQIQIVFRDKSGRAVAVSETWPAHRNMPPHSSFPFSRFITVDTDATTMEMRVIEVMVY